MSSRTFLNLVATGALLIAPGCGIRPPDARDYEVWAADQNLNRIYILDADGETVRIIESAELGDANRPHMLWGVPGDPYVYSANTVSASVTVLDRNSGRVLDVVESVGKAPHAAQPNPADPERTYVFNIGPQAAGADGTPDRGETIAEIRRTGASSWEVTRFLDLKAEPKLSNQTLYPSRRPVCGGFSADGDYMLVTLFDGGLAVVDLESWTVSQSWGSDRIARHGCGFAPSPDGREMYVTAGDMHSSWLYVFDVSGNEPELRASHNLSEAGQDAHGVYVDPEREELWIVHRVSDNVTIHPISTIHDEGHEFAVIESIGETPDLVAFSPDAGRAFVTLRGPNPAPTIPHATVGKTPGITIIDVEERRVLKTVILGHPEDSDFHGIFVPRAHHGSAR